MWTASLFGLLTALTWGVGEFFTSKAVFKFKPLTTLAAVNLLIGGTYATLFATGLVPHHPFSPSTSGVIYALGAGVLLAVGSVGVYRSYAIGPVSLVSPIAGAYPAVTTVIAIAAFGADLAILQIVGIAVIVGGVAIASGLLNRGNGMATARKGPLLAISGALVWGIAFALLAQASLQIGWQWASLFELGALATASITLSGAMRGEERVNLRDIAAACSNKFMLLAAGLQLIGYATVAIGGASNASAGAVVTAISACYPAITALLAITQFKEKIQVVPIMGALAGLSGVVILSLA